MKLKYLLVLVILCLVLGSCVVPKKKYEMLLRAKQVSDSKVHKLIEERNMLQDTVANKNKAIEGLRYNISNLKQEFSDFKYDMSESNAKKSSDIDNLTKKLGSTIKAKKNIKNETQELKGDLEWLRKEKQRNTERISVLEAQLNETKFKNKQLEKQNVSSKNAQDVANKQIEELKSRLKTLKASLNKEETLRAKLQKEISSIKVKKNKPKIQNASKSTKKEAK